jgi:hypothetical protein
VLVLMIQRIVYNQVTNSSKKIKDAVDIDTHLTFGTKSGQHGKKYELRAIILHEGSSIQYGEFLVPSFS